MTTRLRASTRRSFPAIRTAVRQVLMPPCRAGVGGETADHVDHPGRERAGTLELVAGDDDGGAGVDRGAEGRVELVATRRVEAGVGLVEQPQLRPPGDQARERRPAALAGRQPSRPARRRADRARSIRSSAASISALDAPTVDPQKRTFSATVRSAYSPLACPSSPTRARTASRCVAQVAAGDTSLAACERQQPGAQPQQRRLAGAVRTAEQDDLASVHGEVGAGERGERTEDDDGVAQLDDDLVALVHGRRSRYLRSR